MSIADDVSQHSTAKGLGAELHSIKRLLLSLGHDDSYQVPVGPEALAGLWKRYLDLESEKRSSPSSLEKIAFLSWFESLIETETAEWARAFRASGFNFVRTRLEVRLRLGSRLFSRGRTPGTSRDSHAIRKALLPLAVQVLTAAERDSHILNENRRRTIYGMRGVARLFLARDGFQPAEMFRGAVDDLEKSGQLGDTTPEHDEYLREALIRLFDFAPESWIISRLQTLFDLATTRNRQYYADRTKIILARVTAMEKGADRNSLLNEIITAANLGLQSSSESETPDGVFLSHRGFAELLLSQDENERDQLPSLLESAINDLREGAKLGLGGAALSQALLRLSYSVRREDPAQALELLSEARRATALIASPDLLERLVAQIAQNEVGVKISINLANQNAKDLPELCNELLLFGDEAVSSFALTLVHAARLLLRNGNMEAAASIGLRVVSLIERRLHSEEPDAASRSQEILVPNAASLLRQLGDDHFERAYDLYREAIIKAPDHLHGATFTSAADVALQLGKRSARLGNPIFAANFFVDAVEWYEKGIAFFEANPKDVPETFLPVVSHSKLGEAYVRLQAVAPSSDHASSAIKHFEAARALGNNTPELVGNLGDAYYRHGLFHRDSAALHRAFELKAEARSGGHVSRENWSVSASILRKMHFHDRASGWNVQAIHAAVEAHHTDPEWPWPLFQIAEFIEASNGPAVAALIDVNDRPHLAEIRKKIEIEACETIEVEAVKLAISSIEFKKLVLGGRTRVYVLDDPHGLISTTVVLKPTTLENANRELSALGSFKEFLRNSRNSEFLLPQPITVIKQDPNRAIYAMRRAVGRRLSDTLLALSREERTDRIAFELKRALRYLAIFHVWATKGVPPVVSARIGQFELTRIQEGLSLAHHDAKLLGQLVTKAIPMGLLQLRKKDAHAENWIVASEGLMMIDLEANGYRPILFEVTQLIDDFGVIAADDSGFEARLGLAQFYLKSLFDLGLNAQMTWSDLETLYSIFWILRCAFGIGLYRRRQRFSSSSSLRQMALRHDHYRKSLAYLSARGRSDEVRSLARWILAR